MNIFSVEFAGVMVPQLLCNGLRICNVKMHACMLLTFRFKRKSNNCLIRKDGFNDVVRQVQSIKITKEGNVHGNPKKINKNRET